MTLRTTYGLLLLAVLPLPGCITKAMWYEAEETPPIELVSVACEVHDVSVPADGGGDAFGVVFSVVPSGRIPAHMVRYTAEQPGFLALTAPPEHGSDWRDQPGAELLAPSSWELRLTGGNYFSRAGSNARVVFHGTLPRQDIGQLLTNDQLRKELRGLDTDLRTSATPTIWSDRRLEGFAVHRWAELLAPTPAEISYRATPVAWLDREMRVIDNPSVPLFAHGDAMDSPRAGLAELTLLGRLDGEYGEVLWVLIPAAVLMQGGDLQLRRDGDVVRWSREQIWHGRLSHTLPDPATRLAFPVPLRGGVFEYRYATEIEDSKLVINVFKVIATPVTAVLDFVIATNPYLINLINLFREKPIKTDDKSGGK